MAESRLMTAEGVEELRAELDRLMTEERAKVVEQIKTAREWGDLKENSEYHAAKDAQSRLETRIPRDTRSADGERCRLAHPGQRYA